MTGKEELHFVNPSITVDRALEMLVENRITGFPVVDEEWKLVGLVSKYDLLALDSISGFTYFLFSRSNDFLDLKSFILYFESCIFSIQFYSSAFDMHMLDN